MIPDQKVNLKVSRGQSRSRTDSVKFRTMQSRKNVAEQITMEIS